jgi:outer membrane beta-barrel protein
MRKKFARTLFVIATATLCPAGSNLIAQSLDIAPSSYKPGADRKPVAVLQNRFFRKSLRPEAGFLAGTLLNESYTSTNSTGFRLGIFVGEWAGMEAQWISTKVSDSADRKALNKLRYRPFETDATNASEIVSPDPEVNAIHSMRDFTAVAAPFYGKLNLFDQMIVYTDLYLTAGLSALDTDQGPKSALVFGGGQRLYMYESFSVRLDFRNRVFKEVRAETERQRNSWSVDFGASYLFF